MSPDAEQRQLVVDPAVGGRILRKIGPAAWVVLERLAIRTATTTRGSQADTNVRELADDLGISKDTVARSVNKLIAAKVVRRTTFAQDEAGRFASRTYLVDLSKAGLRVLDVPLESGAQFSDKEDGPRSRAPAEAASPAPAAKRVGERQKSSRQPTPESIGCVGHEVVAEGGGRTGRRRIDEAQPSLFGDA